MPSNQLSFLLKETETFVHPQKLGDWSKIAGEWMALSPRLNLYSNVKLTFPDTLFLGIKEMRSGELVFFFLFQKRDREVVAQRQL